MKVDNATLITIYEDKANHSCMVVTLQSHYLASLLGMEKRFFLSPPPRVIRLAHYLSPDKSIH